MIASDDVRRVTFDKAMRGYRCEDVDDYLKQVADSLDYLTAENDDLQKKLQVLAQRIEQYRAEEDTLHTALINAQRLGENVIKEAKQKAADILRTANIKAEDREMRARDEVELAQQQLANVRKETADFKKSLMDMYRKHIELLSQIPDYAEDDVQQQGTMMAPQEEPPVAPVQPVYSEPEVEPDPEPVPQPAATEPEPEPTTYYTTDPQPDYEEPQPYEPEPEDELPSEEKIDTVEFAIAPKGEEPAPAPRFQPGAGLYEEEPEAAPARKPAARTRNGTRTKTSGGRTTRKKKEVEPLPAALDAFEGVDFES